MPKRQRKPFYSIVESSFDVLLAAVVTDLAKVKEDVLQRLLFFLPSFKKQKLKAKQVMSQLRERGRGKKKAPDICGVLVLEVRGMSGAWKGAEPGLNSFRFFQQSWLCTGASLTCEQQWIEKLPFNTWKAGLVFCEAPPPPKKKRKWIDSG